MDEHLKWDNIRGNGKFFSILRDHSDTKNILWKFGHLINGTWKINMHQFHCEWQRLDLFAGIGIIVRSNLDKLSIWFILYLTFGWVVIYIYIYMNFKCTNFIEWKNVDGIYSHLDIRDWHFNACYKEYFFYTSVQVDFGVKYLSGSLGGAKSWGFLSE